MPRKHESPLLSNTRLESWAELIANGEDHFPSNLASSDLDRLAKEVRRRLRDRLIQHIARLIAFDLHEVNGF